VINYIKDPLPSTPNFELLDQSDQAPPSPKCNQIRKFFPEENFILCSSMWEEGRRVSRFFVEVILDKGRGCRPCLKVPKIENFFSSDFQFCTISLLVML
jgi:hypothetical protein